MMVLLIGFFTSFAMAGPHARSVLDYRMGNQGKGFQLLVLSDGQVISKERNLLTWTYLPNEQLSKSQTEALISAVDHAKRNGTTSIVVDLPARLGGPFGTLETYTSDGATMIVYGLAQDEKNANLKRLLCVVGDEADFVREFVQKRASVPLPLDDFPCR